MFRSPFQPDPTMMVVQVQRSLDYSDEYLAMCCGVPVDKVRNWRSGYEQPLSSQMKHMRELLQLNEALSNARSGKYRQA